MKDLTDDLRTIFKNSPTSENQTIVNLNSQYKSQIHYNKEFYIEVKESNKLYTCKAFHKDDLSADLKNECSFKTTSDLIIIANVQYC